MALKKPVVPPKRAGKKKVHEQEEPGLREASSLGDPGLSAKMPRLPDRFYSQDNMEVGCFHTKKKPGAP